MDKRQILRDITFGHRVAEDETSELATYFVETDQWNRLYQGEIDIVYGTKGAGKSALYALLLSRTSQLFDRGILLVGAENPRGAPAFRDLATDPPATEREFMGLWKLYIASLLHALLQDYEIDCAEFRELERALEREGLVKGTLSLSVLLRGIANYVRRTLNPHAVESSIEVDPSTQLPKAYKGKIVFSEPDRSSNDRELLSVDKLLSLADVALRSKKLSAWILLDRLDVAFIDNSDLEVNALRALFRVYLDLAELDNVKLKIFLRNDIWRRITESGFREASHITRHLTIKWDRNSLLNLIVRRAIHNMPLRKAYEVEEELVRRRINEQEQFFYRIFPQQVEVGEKKPNTLDWILSRTVDGTQINAPRELIHFLNVLREIQARTLEVGDPETDGEKLFSRTSFKAALPEVSKVRLEQTLYAEYPECRLWLEALENEKTRHTPESLAAIWNIEVNDAYVRGEKLVSAGFFAPEGTREEPEYWVPFLYRDALNLVQGSAES